MALGNFADELMYVPFTSVYEVPKIIREKLTYDEFFKEGGCYVGPYFDEKIEMLSKTVDVDSVGDDYPLETREMIEALIAGKDAYEHLNRWIETSGDGIFTILGDAGTGKSTFLHHMKWALKNIQWYILDLKKSAWRIKVHDLDILFSSDDFSTLSGKVMSFVLQEISNKIFVKRNTLQSKKNIRLLLERYNERIVGEEPLREYTILYEKLGSVPCSSDSTRGDREYCRRCAEIIIEYFSPWCKDLQDDRFRAVEAINCVLTHYLIFNSCFETENKKEIIVFDNIERFIGTDEIFNRELDDFLRTVRAFCDNYRGEYMECNINQFAQKYQFIVSMRNTTVRNHTPAEGADFPRHTIDLSSWFAIDDIILAKLNWYERNGIAIINPKPQKHLISILSDLVPMKNGTINGLRIKLDLLFNYDKRLITVFLTKTLHDPTPYTYMDKIDYFYDLSSGSGPIASCSRFAYRSVVWRLVLDRLRAGSLFKEGIFQKFDTKEGRIANTNYVWKILTVLHNFSHDNGGKETGSSGIEQYMPFLDLIKAVYNETGDFTTRFYGDGFSNERERMASLLFYMNSYSRETNNLFQFIDIQYNVECAHHRHLNHWDDLRKLFLWARSDPQQLKIRITTAGKAYLGYVATTFEFISCMSKKQPLFCCLPSEAELLVRSVKEQTCYIVIQKVMKNIKKYISNFEPQANNPHLLYKRKNGIEGETFKERLVKSVFGYLTEYCDCIDRLVAVEDKEAESKKKKLISLIISEANELWCAYLPERKY